MQDTENKPADEPKDKEPEFDGEFDAEKAKRLAANLRAEVEDLKGRLASVTAERDEFRTAAEKSGEDRDNALKAAIERAEKAERVIALKDAGLPDDVIEEFSDYLTGTAEEVAAKAAKLAKRLAPKEDEKPSDESDKSGEDDEDDEVDLPNRPEPKLTPGHGAEVSTDFDPAAIARAARRH